jgi:transposase-like protein
LKIAYDINEKSDISLDKIGYNDTKINVTKEIFKSDSSHNKKFLNNKISNFHQNKKERLIIHLK